MRRFLAWLLTVPAALAFVQPCWGQDARIITQTFAPANPQMAAVAGTVTVEVTCPNKRAIFMGQVSVGRSVRLIISRPGTAYRQVSNQLLPAGLDAANMYCPMARVVGPRSMRDNTTDFVSVWEPPEIDASPVEVFRGERFSSITGQWGAIADLSAQREQQQLAQATIPSQIVAPSPASAPITTAPPPRPLTKAELRAKRRAERQAALAAKRAAAAAEKLQKKQAAELVRGLWFIGSLATAVGLLVAAFRYRIQIMRFWFLHFDPHPATPLIEAAIMKPESAGEGLGMLATVLGELPPNGAARREARLIQAERLYGKLRSASIAQQLAYAEKARRQEVELHEKVAFRGMQESLMHASIALERAKAAYATALSLKKIGAV